MLKEIHYLLKAFYRKKNDNKKKSQVIQHLHGISEVNHLHDYLSRPIIFMRDYSRVSISCYY